MMYSEGLVVVVKCNGKILREDKDLVTLPFGSEYSILLKNLESRKAQLKVSVDGQDVLDGNFLILQPNSEAEIEGFVKGHLGKNKFKFIQKTKEISDYRGDRLDDGIIRVEYWFEKIIEKREITTEHWTYHWNWPYYTYLPIIQKTYQPNIRTYGNGTVYYGTQGGLCSTNGASDGVSGLNGPAGCSGSSNSNSTPTLNCYHVDSLNFPKESFSPRQEEGITVKGSEINQQYNFSWIGPLEDHSRVIILRLTGVKSGNYFVKTPITVKSKTKCSSCGKISKSYSKFCSRCGTFLE